VCLALWRGLLQTIAQGWANVRFLSVLIPIMHESNLRKNKNLNQNKNKRKKRNYEKIKLTMKNNKSKNKKVKQKQKICTSQWHQHH
jgi:hypothetical protein